MKIKYLTMIAIFTPLAAMAADGFSGFADMQFNWTKQQKGRGFVLNDGAVYFAKTFSNTDFFIDIPFAWEGSTTDGTTTTYSNNFKIAKEKAQAFFGLNYDVQGTHLRVQAGQFDVPYGVDSNDSVDNPFTNVSLLGFTALPYTHTGVMLSADQGNFGIKALVSNAHIKDPNNPGYLSQGSRGSENFEFGGLVSFSSEMFRLKGGYLGHNQAGTPGMQSLYHVAAGASVQILDVDVEGDFIKVGRAALQKGVMLQTLLKAADKLTLGARGEMLSKMSNHSATQLTFGPQYQIYQPLKLKADVTWNKTQATSGATKATTTSMNIAGVYRF